MPVHTIAKKKVQLSLDEMANQKYIFKNVSNVCSMSSNA